MPETDLVVELLHYDPENYRLAFPIRDGVAEVTALGDMTSDISHLQLRVVEPADFAFLPGQYVDLHVPGDAGGARRSFSLANLPGDGRLELMIKRYPGGRLSGMLADGSIKVGDRISFTGPYGAFHLRRSERPILMIAGGSGMAPILGVLRQLVTEGCDRPVRFFYGARTEQDLFMVDEIGAMALGDFAFTPVTGRFVHEAVQEFLAAEPAYAQPDVYMCGPPPMIEAAEAMLARHGVDEQRIFMDKFTTSADAPDAPDAPAPEPEAAQPPAKRISDMPVHDGDQSEREFSWYQPRKRRASLYEDVTIDTQPSIHRHLKRGWPLSFEDGRGTWDDGSTALRCEDWYAFRDPAEQWERTFYQRGTAMEHQIEGALASAAQEGLMDDYTPEWVEFLRAHLQVPAFYEHGLWFATASIARDCLSDSVATCVCLQAAMKQRSAQSLVLYAMDLEQHFGPFPIEAARAAFLDDDVWQPTRSYLERLGATTDWGEVVVAANLCLEPVVGTLLRRELGTRVAGAHGDMVTPVLARVETQEWEWVRGWTVELIRFLLGDASHGEANRELITGWVREWLPEAVQAAMALAPLAGQVPGGVDVEQAVARVTRYAGRMLAQSGLSELCSLVGYEPSPDELPEEVVAAPTRRVRIALARAGANGGSAPPPAGSPPAADASGTYDFVGIVMAKSAEGDAVAAILGARDGIEVMEQPAFWDIRARDRLVIPYDRVSEQLGYEIDAYSIQHEMSTHYGRMVATDEALMLFSDPTEAMQYLMA
jgi:NAD(P)H-flavin reductase